MMYGFEITTVRVIVIASCSFSILLMLGGFVRYRKWWETKTRDYWFGRLMWCISGGSACLEAIIRGTPFRYSLIFFLCASVVTLKGLLTKGSWGTPKEAIEEKAKEEKAKEDDAATGKKLFRIDTDG